MAELSRVIWKPIPGTCGIVKYFKFKDNTRSWILPVYEGSYTAQHPAESFPWNKDIIFVGEVSEEEYNRQFQKQQEVQLELF